MIDLLNAPLSGLGLTKVYITEELKKRGGWQAYLYHANAPHIRIVRPDGKELELYGSTSPSTTFAAGKLADDKYATYQKLKDNDLPTPETFIAYSIEEARKILESNTVNSWVVKPLDSSHGNGVTVGVPENQSLEEAWAHAIAYSKSVLLQHQLESAFDTRFTIVGNKVAGVVIRVPARVIGDGNKTIKELIEAENAGSHRGENYSQRLNKIDMNRAQAYLGDKLAIVPEAGQQVQVVGTANVGTGGELIDITDTVPSWLIKIAEKVAIVCGLPVSGVDIMLSKMPTPNSGIDELSPAIIEVNKSPSLFLNDILREDGEHLVTKAFVNYLEQL